VGGHTVLFSPLSVPLSVCRVPASLRGLMSGDFWREGTWLTHECRHLGGPPTKQPQNPRSSLAICLASNNRSRAVCHAGGGKPGILRDARALEPASRHREHFVLCSRSRSAVRARQAISPGSVASSLAEQFADKNQCIGIMVQSLNARRNANAHHEVQSTAQSAITCCHSTLLASSPTGGIAASSFCLPKNTRGESTKAMQSENAATAHLNHGEQWSVGLNHSRPGLIRIVTACQTRELPRHQMATFETTCNTT
jgi:hypothetical protein